jgi:glycosyltransferase involved in cell wall biosynthesis
VSPSATPTSSPAPAAAIRTAAPPTRIRLLEVLEATTAGTGKHLETLLRGLDRDVFDVEVACPAVRDEWADKGDTRFVAKVRALNVPVHTVQMRSGIKPLADVVGLLRLYQLVRRGRYDVVHLHSSKAGFLGRLAAKMNGVKTVYTPNGLYFLRPGAWPTRRFFLLLEQLAGRLTDCLIAVSDSECRAVVETHTIAASKVKTIPNAVECDDSFRPDPEARRRIRAELGLGPDAFVIGTASRHSKQKDPLTLIRAARFILDGAPNSRFVWCGDGEKKLQSLVAARQVDVYAAFQFLGFRHDIQDVMNAFDVFVLSSVYEGLPYVVLEAMLLELPVVATDVVGNRDTVVDGETGVLVPPQQPKALAAAVLELAHDPERRRAMGRRGAQVVRERHAIAGMVAATQQVYRALAAR